MWSNTLVLLTSSWFVARSVLAARDGDHDRAVRLTYLGGGFGVLFIADQGLRVGRRKSRTATPSRRNELLQFYYMLTGVHLFHVALGVLILGRGARTAQPAPPPHVDGRVRGDLLAHGRPALDRHLRAVLRDEVNE